MTSRGASASTAAAKQATAPAAPSFFRRMIELLLLLFTAITALFFYKSAEEATEEKLRLEEELRRVRRGRSGPNDDGKCAVCMHNPLELVLQPCGHVCLCRDCGGRLDKCPICREDIEEKKNVFLSS